MKDISDTIADNLQTQVEHAEREGTALYPTGTEIQFMQTYTRWRLPVLGALSARVPSARIAMLITSLAGWQNIIARDLCVGRGYYAIRLIGGELAICEVTDPK